MLTIIKYAALIGSLSLLVIGHSPYLSKKCAPFFAGYAMQFGDLYQKSNLPEFNKKFGKCGARHQNTGKKGGNNLFLLGDSFFAALELSSGNFKNAENIYSVHWLDQLDIPELPQGRNILIMECVERGLLFDFGFENITIDKTLTENRLTERRRKNSVAKIVTIESEFFTMKQLLFSDYFSMHVKELKAALNEKLFNRVDENVRLANGWLLFNEETDGFISSFEKLSDGKIDSIVQRFNQHYKYYKEMGFDEIYLTIIPNKVSIVAPDYKGRVYNEAATRVKNHGGLLPVFIEMYSLLKKGNESADMYYRNDTHWNCEGRQVFYDYVNNNILNK